MTSHPKDLSDELIEVMKHSQKNLYHSQVQNSSCHNRKYTKEQYLELAEKMKTTSEYFSTTDIIVGFPGEKQRKTSRIRSRWSERYVMSSAFTFIYSKTRNLQHSAAAMENTYFLKRW